MTAILEPGGLEVCHTEPTADSDLTVEIATSELLDLEAEMIFRMVDGPGLTDAERYQLVAVEREINRRWSIR